METRNATFFYLIALLCAHGVIGQVSSSDFNELEKNFEKEEYRIVIDLGEELVLKIDDSQKPDVEFLIAKSLENLNKEDSAFFHYQIALKGYSDLGRLEQLAETNFRVHSLLSEQNNLDVYSDIYFKEFYEYAIKTNNPKLLAKAYNSLGSINFNNNDSIIPKKYFQKALTLYFQLDDIDNQVRLLSNLGALYNGRMKKRDSARYFYFKALKLIENTTNIKNSNTRFNLYNNIGNSYRVEGKYRLAIESYKNAESLNISRFNLKSRKILYANMNASYYYSKDFEKAYDYLYMYDSIKDVINLTNQNSTISDIQEKYNNQKLRADNLENETKRKQNRNLLFLSLFVISIGLGIAILLQKNTTKKRKLAEQTALLEQQKTETLLKDQELLSIDAMIAGQEKERQRVANELHDDLGSKMATIKLHVENIKTDKEDPSFKYASKLLEEAYQKIRGISHVKNSGVIAKQGLLPALEGMARTISETNKILLTVHDFGLENRMENSLELSIFRMVQELVTNIIKHAEATKGCIQLTQHEDSLNIMIEDNGKGFDPTAIPQTDSGIGLRNIEKRIEHLEGSFTIDSALDNGTSIIIDIPI